MDELTFMDQFLVNFCVFHSLQTLILLNYFIIACAMQIIE